MSAPATLPFRVRGAILLRLLAVQGAWNYETLMGNGIAFAEGQAVSQRVIGRSLAGWFDGVVTVAPHLHRTHDLGDVFPGRAAIALQPVEEIGRAHV